MQLAFLIISIFWECVLHNSLLNRTSFFNFQSFITLPWNCRIVEWGKKVKMMTTKTVLPGTMTLAKINPKISPTDILQKVIGKKPKLECKGHYIGSSLSPSNPILHPTIMYGQWCNWDGKPLATKPLFYNGIHQTTAHLLYSVSDDVISVAGGIMKIKPEVCSKGGGQKPHTHMVVLFSSRQQMHLNNVYLKLSANIV